MGPRAWSRGAASALLMSLAVTAGAAQAATTERVNVASDGTQADFPSYVACISADGRYVAFTSGATNLVPDDTNGVVDVFVHDRETGLTERVSLGPGGVPGNGHTQDDLTISADGRFVAFRSLATNLVVGDTNGQADIFVHDRSTGTTERVNVGPNGIQADEFSYRVAISADGRYVAFISGARNLVPDDTNGVVDVFVRDRANGTTERVSTAADGGEADGLSSDVGLSADGRFVSFGSRASNLVTGDSNGTADVFVHDRLTGTTERVSVNSLGEGANADASVHALSADGRFVVFSSLASNLVAGDTNDRVDVFLRDRAAGTTERVSVDAAGAQVDLGGSTPNLSSDGRVVIFESYATNLVPGDINAKRDIFLRDLALGTVERVNVASDDTQANDDAYTFFGSVVSADGRFTVFVSRANNLVAGDTNLYLDVFVRDRARCGNRIHEADEECDDGGVTPGDGCDASCRIEPCPPAPVHGCRPAIQRKSLLRIRDAQPDTGDQLQWSWRGDDATVADFGDPTATDDYALCVYGAGSLVSTTVMPAAGTCRGHPCWQASATGYRYADPELSPDGAQQLTLTSDPVRGAAHRFRGRGLDLDMPLLGPALGAPVTVQLRRRTGESCWSATFSAPFTRNDDVRFLDKSD